MAWKKDANFLASENATEMQKTHIFWSVKGLNDFNIVLWCMTYTFMVNVRERWHLSNSNWSKYSIFIYLVKNEYVSSCANSKPPGASKYGRYAMPFTRPFKVFAFFIYLLSIVWYIWEWLLKTEITYSLIMCSFSHLISDSKHKGPWYSTLAEIVEYNAVIPKLLNAGTHFLK